MNSVKLVLAMMLAVAIVQLHASDEKCDTKLKLFDIAVDFRIHNLGRLSLAQTEEELLKITSDPIYIKQFSDHAALAVIAVEQYKKLNVASYSAIKNEMMSIN